MLTAPLLLKGWQHLCQQHQSHICVNRRILRLLTFRYQRCLTASDKYMPSLLVAPEHTCMLATFCTSCSNIFIQSRSRSHSNVGIEVQHVRNDVAKHVYIRMGTKIMLIDISIHFCVFLSFFFDSTNCADAWRALFSYVF